MSNPETTAPLSDADFLDGLEQQIRDWPRYQGWGTHPYFDYDDIAHLVAMARRSLEPRVRIRPLPPLIIPEEAPNAES